MEETKTVQVLSPDESYSRHSEGDFLRLKDGRILFVYCRFQGNFADDSHCDLAASFSSDEGEHWTTPETLIRAEMYGVDNIMSVSLMRMGNGDLGVFYLVKVSPAHTRVMLSRSRDEGKSFYAHIECTDPRQPFYFVVNNSRVERLKSGRLVIPMAYHRATRDPEGEYYRDGRALATFLLSDDDGQTWHESADMIYPPFTGTESGLQEPGVIEHGNGTLRAYFRTDRLAHYESFSPDGGEHWSVPQPSRFSGPCSPLEIVRRAETGALYAVWNPIPNYTGRETTQAGWGRTPLVCAVSTDDGMTWGEPWTVAGDEKRGYCYPAVFFTQDHSMLIAYCSGGPQEGICLAQLTIQKRMLAE